MTRRKRIFTAVLATVLMLGLTACGTGVSQKKQTAEERMILLVQGNLDEIYLGKTAPEYLDLIDSTEEEAKQTYEDGLSYEAEYFADYFDIDNLTDELTAQIVALYREIYSHARYTVGNARQLDESSYAVEVTVEPIDVMELAEASRETALEDFSRKYADADAEAMTDEEYEAYDADWAQAVIAMVEAQIPNLGYKETVSITMQIALEGGVWQISSEDMAALDEQIIYYP